MPSFTYEKLYEGEIITRPESGLIKLYAPTSGTLERVKVIVNNASAIVGTWYLNVAVNGLNVLSGTGTGSTNMLRLTSADKVSSKNVSVAVSEGDLITMSVVISGAGGLAAPIAFVFDINDGVEYQGSLTPVSVADEAARFALTGKIIGDTVKQLDTSQTFVVVDPDELDNASGYLLIAEPGSSHAPVTATDSDTVDLSLTGQDISASVITQQSLTSDASGIKLSGDTASPGNNKVYGTDGSGTRGWKDDPSGSGGSDVVFAAVHTDHNIHSVSEVTIFSKSLLIAAGDTIRIEVEALILNDTGGTRTYTFTANVGSEALAAADATATQPNSANVARLKYEAIIGIKDDNEARMFCNWQRSALAADNSAGNYTESNRVSHKTVTSDLTGTKTVSFGVTSSSVSGSTQTFRVVSARIRKIPAVA